MTKGTVLTPEQLKQAIAQVLAQRESGLPAVGDDVEELFEKFNIYHQELEYQNEELRRITEELEITKSHWNDLYENAPIAYASFDSESRIVLGNLAFRKALGLDRVTLSQTPFTNFLSPSSQDVFYFHARSVLKGNPTEACQLQLVVNRKILHFKIESNLGKAANTAVIRSTLTDITREVETEKLLQASEERFKGVVEAAADGILIADQSGRILVWNASMETITGYPRTTVVGQFLWDAQFMLAPASMRTVKSQKALETFNRGFLLALKNGAPTQTHEQPIEKSDGSNAFIEFTVYPLNLKDEILFGCIFRDVTKTRQLEDQLVQARKVEAIGLLAGGIAHDFNNLLGVIFGRLEMAKTRQELSAALQHDLLQIEGAARRSAHITRQLLTYARKQVVVPQVVNLNAVLTDLLPTIRLLLGSRVHFDFLQAPDLFPLLMDPSQVAQVVSNLCTNARDAMNGTGRLLISTANLTEKKQVVLTVKDNGSGMDEATLGKIFEPFFTTKTMGHGTGLGLATVQGIVYQNKGTIQVESHVGKGTTVTIAFPAFDGPSFQDQKVTDAEPCPMAPKKILVVEDEPEILEFLGFALTSLGHQVNEAGSAEAALAQQQQTQTEYDLLVTDVMLPGKNGRVLAEELTHRLPHLKVLYISGYSGDVLADQGVLTSGVNFLQKPFTLDELISKVGASLTPPPSSQSSG